MKLNAMLLAVRDMEKSVAFYQSVLGLRVTEDFGANKTLTGGLALQTLDTWEDFIERKKVIFGSNAAEVYFETQEFDRFLERLAAAKDVAYVHAVKEHAWGQRAVRFYDPDRHIIEVGEDMKAVCKRFLDQGMTIEAAAKRMDVPESCVKRWSK